MFGSFTQTEVQVVKAWINELGSPVQTPRPDPKVYFDFTNQLPRLPSVVNAADLDITVDYPVLPTSPVLLSVLDGDALDSMPLKLDKDSVNLSNLLPLWFTSPTLLESLPSVPVRVADALVLHSSESSVHRLVSASKA